nr:immunoglobulin light chain junction region [Macaca mulatta]
DYYCWLYYSGASLF